MSQAQQILNALGGFDNIVEIEPCITRLRCELENASVVDEAALKAAGAHGVVTVGDVGVWGHEVEWSAKNKQRLRRLMIAYGRSRRYDGGIYYYTDSTRHVVESCATAANERLRDAGLGPQIITRSIETIESS